MLLIILMHPSLPASGLRFVLTAKNCSVEVGILKSIWIIETHKYISVVYKTVVKQIENQPVYQNAKYEAGT